MKKNTEASHYDILAVRAANGDQIAFAELYEYSFPRVYNFIFAKVKDAELADDIVSDVFIKVYQKLGMYDREKAAFSTWLFRMALNTMTDNLRKQDRKREDTWEDFFDPAGPVSEQPESVALKKEQNDTLLKAIDKLNERGRRIVELKFWSGLSNTEIAEIMDLSVSNVGTILTRAMIKLRKILGDNAPDLGE